MRISYSRYDCFWRNSERYRLTYGRNLVPAITPFALGRGTVMHLFAECRNKGLTQIETQQRVEQCEVKDSRQIAVGQALFSTFAAKYEHDDRIRIANDIDGNPLAEVEFDLPLPGSPHRIAGKFDEIIHYKDKLWLGDMKSASAKSRRDMKEAETRTSKQPDFYMLAARQLGYEVEGMLYRYITEKTPPEIWEIEARRSQHQLDVAALSIHQTCEMIEMMINTFGVDIPWPHDSHAWPCSTAQEKCEYSSICGRATAELTDVDYDGFKTREEHLEILKPLDKLAKEAFAAGLYEGDVSVIPDGGSDV